MKRSALLIAVVAVVSAMVVSPARGEAQAAGASPQMVLLVGNSMSRGVSKPLRKLLQAAGYRTKVKVAAPNRWTLGHHAGSRTTERKIRSRAWDFVVLQEQSDGIHKWSYPDARALATTVDERGAALLFMMTWRDRNDPIDSYDRLRGVPGGIEGYVPIAFELGAPVAPVGWAVRESLVEEAPLDLWSDGHHLNRRGTHLQACVLFATMTRRSPVGLEPPRKVSPLEADYLQQLAEDIVFDSPGDWDPLARPMIP